MGILRHGVHQQLEDEADAILKRDLSKTTSVRDKSDILTPAKQALRRRREVLVASGTPDSSVRQGIYGRSLNRVQTHLNSRDSGSMAAKRTQQTPRSVRGLERFMDRHLG